MYRILIFGILLLISCKNKTEDVKKIITTDDMELNIPKYTIANKQLFDTIVALDKIYWEAYNSGNVDRIINFMTDDHEFYHDESGALYNKEKNAEEWRKFYNMDLGVVGETVNGTNEIYEIAKYGALQISYQRFYDKRDPEWSKPARAVTLWKKTSKGWLQSRVFSLH